MFNDVGIRGDV